MHRLISLILFCIVCLSIGTSSAFASGDYPYPYTGPSDGQSGYGYVPEHHYDPGTGNGPTDPYTIFLLEMINGADEYEEVSKKNLSLCLFFATTPYERLQCIIGHASNDRIEAEKHHAWMQRRDNYMQFLFCRCMENAGDFGTCNDKYPTHPNDPTWYPTPSYCDGLDEATCPEWDPDAGEDGFGGCVGQGEGDWDWLENLNYPVGDPESNDGFDSWTQEMHDVYEDWRVSVATNMRDFYTDIENGETLEDAIVFFYIAYDADTSAFISSFYAEVIASGNY